MKTFLFFVFLVLGFDISAQNLIVNGSMTSPKGADIVAPGWYKYSNSPGNVNTPDVNDTAGALNTSPGYEWYGGTPLLSPDGGTWQNVYRLENFAQDVTGLTIGQIYYFRYYYASQGISTGPPSAGFVYPFPPNVQIIGATGYMNPSPGKLFEWVTYSGAIVPTASTITIICSADTNDSYMAYDGFYLGTNAPDNFLQVSSPSSDTLCSSGNAFFTVQSAAATSYQWQQSTGSDWQIVNNNDYYGGATSNSLEVKNVNTTMNNFQYRCYVTSSCCIAYSDPATLLVASLPNPSLKTNTGKTDICGISSLTISTDSGYRNYMWSDQSKGLNIIVNQPGLYWVQVTDNFNCKGSDSIKILPCGKLVAPNAFTPNGDGLNDVFKPTVIGTVANYKLSIFNRWGQLVFQTSDPGKGWDGTIDGELQPSGVFVWNCRFQLSGDSEENQNGTFVLIR